MKIATNKTHPINYERKNLIQLQCHLIVLERWQNTTSTLARVLANSSMNYTNKIASR